MLLKFYSLSLHILLFLQDNIDTLGKEIARLTMEHQQKQIDN